MRTVHAALLTLLCGASFGLGVYASQAPTSVTAVLTGEPRSYSPWREDLAALRGTAEGHTLRATALDAIADAPNQSALEESVTLLGWVGDERDIPLLVQVLHDETVDTACIEALGRLGAVDALMELTQHPEHRAYAQVGLGMTGQEEALPLLFEGLSDPVRRPLAVQGLGQHGSEAAQEALVDAWRQSEHGFLPTLAQTMSTFPPDSLARETLRESMTTGTTAQRSAAMAALAEVDDPELFDALMEAVDQGSPQQRLAALNAMGRLNDPRAVPALAKAAKQGRRQEVGAAIWALAALQDERAEEALQELVRTASEEVAALAAGALDPTLHETSYEVLLWALEHRGSTTQSTVYDALFYAPWTQVPDEIVELALEQIEAPQSTSRWSGNAWTLVLKHGDPESQARVSELLLDPNTPGRAEALWALHGEPHLLADALAYELLGDENPDVRRAALGMLEARGDTGDGKLEKALIQRLKDPDRSNWDGLEDTLARIGGPEAIDALMGQVSNGTHDQSNSALSAMVNTGDPDHMARLQGLYQRTDDEELRRRVLDSALWGGPGVSHPFAMAALERETDPGLRAAAASALASAGTPEAIQTLEGLLQEDDPQVRSAALGALAGQPGMRTRLIGALDDPELAHTALSALQGDRSDEARKAVNALVTNPNADTNLRSTAIYQMGWSGGDPSVLRQVLQDDDLNVRYAALSALEARGTTESAGHIATVLDDDELSTRAAYALQRIGGETYEANRERVQAILGEEAEFGWEDPGGFGHLGGLGYLELADGPFRHEREREPVFPDEPAFDDEPDFDDEFTFTVDDDAPFDDEPLGDTGWFEDEDPEFSVDTGWTGDEDDW